MQRWHDILAILTGLAKIHLTLWEAPCSLRAIKPMFMKEVSIRLFQLTMWGKSMRASDIMTRQIIAIDADSTVAEAAKRMLERHISGMPVVDKDGRVVGIISEGDLLRRSEVNTARDATGRRHSWWLTLFAGPFAEQSEEVAEAYTKEHSRLVRDVMTHNVVCVDESASLEKVVSTMESRRIKRVPVVSDHRIVGIISRANLMRVLTSVATDIPAPTTDDRSLRAKVIDAFKDQSWAPDFGENIVVRDGVVQLWGTVSSEAHREALVVAARNVPGVKAVEDNIEVIDYRAEGNLLD
jgi:CBS domain-containing protein